MIRMHMTFLYTKKMERVTLFLLCLMSVFLYSLTDFQTSISTLLFQQDMAINDFVSQAFLIIKLMVVVYCLLWWIYGVKLNQYDVYLYTRYSPILVVLTKTIVIGFATLLFTIIVTMLMILFWLPYPGMIPVLMVYGLLGNMVFFVLYYNILFALISRIFSHLFLLFVPLLGYVLTMLGGETFDGLPNANNIPWLQLVFPDIQFDGRYFVFYFGNLFVLTTIVIFGFIFIIINRNCDFY